MEQYVIVKIYPKNGEENRLLSEDFSYFTENLTEAKIYDDKREADRRSSGSLLSGKFISNVITVSDYYRSTLK